MQSTSHAVVPPLHVGEHVSPRPSQSNVQEQPSGQVGEQPVPQAVVQHPPLVHDEHGLAHMGAHVPLLQVVAHELPQVPQCIAEVVRSTSQPFPGSPSQSPRPASQLKTHPPPVQVSVASRVGPQAPPQIPQCATDVASSSSHPLTALPSQSPYPAAQANPQVPPEQVAEAFGGDGHAVPHAPQWAGSL